MGIKIRWETHPQSEQRSRQMSHKTPLRPTPDLRSPNPSHILPNALQPSPRKFSPSGHLNQPSNLQSKSKLAPKKSQLKKPNNNLSKCYIVRIKLISMLMTWTSPRKKDKQTKSSSQYQSYEAHLMLWILVWSQKQIVLKDKQFIRLSLM